MAPLFVDVLQKKSFSLDFCQLFKTLIKIRRKRYSECTVILYVPKACL